MKESDIRPKELFNKYLELSLKDAENFSKDNLVEINCPACDSKSRVEKFDKNGFKFEICSDCSTLFCNPRPSEDDLASFYQSSESSDFWANEFFPAVAEARREKMFRPRAQKMISFLKDKSIDPQTICDVGAGYGILLDEIQKLKEQSEMYAIEPGEELAKECLKKGFKTLQKTCEDAIEWHHKFDLVVCCEVIEHVFSPLDFVGSLNKLVKKNGYCLITGLGFEGFDTLSLGSDSKSIFPPHHINFMSVDGFENLFKRAGFSEVEVITPGVLDIDIVINSDYRSDFVDALKRRGEKTLQDFQEFLVRNQLSSHVWVLAKN